MYFTIIDFKMKEEKDCYKLSPISKSGGNIKTFTSKWKAIWYILKKKG